jgi:hypothetical protein
MHGVATQSGFLPENNIWVYAYGVNCEATPGSGLAAVVFKLFYHGHPFQLTNPVDWQKCSAYSS